MINLNCFRFGNALTLGVVFNIGFISVAAQEIFKTDFEVTEGYEIGSLNDQLYWQADQVVKIDDYIPYSDSQFIWSSPGLANNFSLAFDSLTPASKLYVDFYLSPSVAASFDDLPQELADPSAAVSSLINIGNRLGELVVVNGDGAGGGIWQRTGYHIVIEDEYNVVKGKFNVIMENSYGYHSRKWIFINISKSP